MTHYYSKAESAYDEADALAAQRVALNAQVKAATAEYLSHRGMDPYRVRPGGQELWEVHAPAMRAALAVAQRMQPPAGETIRTTQDGSMEAAPETGQSPVGAAFHPIAQCMVDAGLSHIKPDREAELLSLRRKEIAWEFLAAEPGAAEGAASQFRLWFFRDLVPNDRRALFSLFGMPTDEITNHGAETLALRYILKALAAAPHQSGESGNG